MKTLTTKVFKVNGQFDVYATETTVRTQGYADVAKEMGKDWDNMSSRSKGNFRRRHNCKPIPTRIEVFEIKATIPNIFSEHQLKDAAIHHLIHPATGTLFLRCKNGESGYETVSFTIKRLEDIIN